MSETQEHHCEYVEPRGLLTQALGARVTTYRDGRGLIGNVQPKVNDILARFGKNEITHVWGPGNAPDHNNLRCCDFMVPTIAIGNRVASYLIVNAKRYGIIGIIWNRRVMGFPSNGNSYRGPEGQWRTYGGSHPHNDHLHVEFNNNRMTGTVPSPSPGVGQSLDEVARRVIKGEFGNQPERERRLTAAGHDYARVQSRVRELLATPKHTRYRVTTKRLPLNGRAGPGSRYRVTMTAAKNYVLDIVEIRNGWAKSTGGHWYSTRYLTKV